MGVVVPMPMLPLVVTNNAAVGEVPTCKSASGRVVPMPALPPTQRSLTVSKVMALAGTGENKNIKKRVKEVNRGQRLFFHALLA